jgi:NADH:ubiquinone oxidoreductase subunit F (NADH-binding)
MVDGWLLRLIVLLLLLLFTGHWYWPLELALYPLLSPEPCALGPRSSRLNPSQTWGSGRMSMLERARRLAVAPTNAVDALATGMASAEVSLRTGLPEATVQGIQSYYGVLDGGIGRPCVGTACQHARGWVDPVGPTVHCVGRCYAAPASLDVDEHPIPIRSLVDPPILLRHVLGARPDLADLYRCPPAEQILATIEASGLRGRGGAAFATGAKWRVAAEAPADERFVVANGDEGDPGAFVDRLLLERDPHAVLAGLAACAVAIGARRGIVYLRGEYPVAASRVRAAIEEARPWLPAGLAIELHIGAGSYVAGEETALLRAIEGLRAEPAPKPPYPAQAGLRGKPTVVQNVETLASIPWVLANGRRPGVKGFSLSGAIRSPGVVEAPFGISLRELLQLGGDGALPGRPWKMALIGGPMGCVLPEHAFDTPLTFSRLPNMGHAGIVVFDHSVSAAQLAAHLYAFARNESCGNCAPCRVGSAQLARCRDQARLERLLLTLEQGSLCGFGQGIPKPLRDLLRHYPDEMFGTEGQA